jgi:Flp pilus assembly protein TadD
VLALHEDSLVLALAPHDANALRRTADVEARLGRWDAASAHAAEALELDPQSVQAAAECGFIELFRRRYTRAGAALEQAAALSPTKLGVIEERVLVMLGEGDLTGARTLLRAVPASIDRNKLVAYIATYIDLGWALDASDADRVLTLRPAEFGDDRATWAFALTQQYAFQGDRRHARIYADTARLAYEAELVTTPDDAEGRALLGVTLAYLGRRDDAIREGTRATALLPIGRDALLGPYIQYQLVRIYTLLGEPARALDALEPLLGVPYTVSPAWLRIDPNLAPLRDNPRFRRLATDASPPELPQRSVGASGGVERR